MTATETGMGIEPFLLTFKEKAFKTFLRINNYNKEKVLKIINCPCAEDQYSRIKDVHKQNVHSNHYEINTALACQTRTTGLMARSS